MDLMQQQQSSSSTTVTKMATKKVKKITQMSSRTSSIETIQQQQHHQLLSSNNNNNNIIESDEYNNNNNLYDQDEQQHELTPTTIRTGIKKSANKISKKLKTSKKIDSIEKTDSIEEEYTNVNYNNNNNDNNIDDDEYNNDNLITKQVRKKSIDKNGKKKTKKSKKSDDTKENISVKSSFRKFDALQKKNSVNVGLNDSGKAHENISDPTILEGEPTCRKCGKITYKMEEIKAERGSWHKSCFKCIVCNKQLNVDTFESHEGILYCKPHFKILLAPKAVEDSEPEKPKKHELIIRENQPVELPPDVARSSDKSDLGLEELQQLNVRSRFQVFENYQENRRQQQQKELHERNPPGEMIRANSIQQKLARFQKHAKGQHNYDDENNSENNSDLSESEEEPIDSGEEDPDLVRAKRAQRERPIRFDQMDDIKSKFEKGTLQSREERREERKQELQNIRSRLFLGKQARIKEQYQQAVADSEQGITASGKKPDIDIGDKAKTLKEKFEKGEMFKEQQHNKVQDEMDVFDAGISKQSRSLFLELDATAFKSPSTPSTPRTPGISNSKSNIAVSPLQEDLLRPFNGENLVKYDEKPEDIKIETSEISSKFKFFETFKGHENKPKKQFRITPPREGVVKMPSPEDEEDNDNIESKYNADPQIAEQQQTATKMLNRFRELEQKKFVSSNNGVKPLKRFTPPPDGNRRVYYTNNSDEEEEEYEEEEDDEEEGEEEYDEEEYEEDKNRQNKKYHDEFIEMAQSAARAKQLRAKFEKWEASEIKREMNNGTNGVNLHENIEESQTESAKSLKAKFEQLKNQPTTQNRPKIQVNRFVIRKTSER